MAGNPLDGRTDGTGAAVRYSLPLGIATDGTDLYVADARNNAIRRIGIQTGIVTTLAGDGTIGSSDGTGTTANFAWPHGITTDGTNLYVADQDNHTVRKIVISTGVVTTLAGSAGSTGDTDGVGAEARFNLPSGITTDGTNLYVAEFNNMCIRKIVIATGEVTTLARASSWWPYGITTDGTSLFVADDGNHVIRKVVMATGDVSTFAGSLGIAGSDDGTGLEAKFSHPGGITSDGTNLYVADFVNGNIRKIVIATGVVTTIAGSAGITGCVDGTGSSARFSDPRDITTDGTSLFVTDGGNYSIRRID
jgi:hypothetical protein